MGFVGVALGARRLVELRALPNKEFRSLAARKIHDWSATTLADCKRLMLLFCNFSQSRLLSRVWLVLFLARRLKAQPRTRRRQT